MPFLSRVIGGLRGLLQRRTVEQDLDAELHDFLETATERNERAGMSREAAIRAARLQLTDPRGRAGQRPVASGLRHVHRDLHEAEHARAERTGVAQPPTGPLHHPSQRVRV